MATRLTRNTVAQGVGYSSTPGIHDAAQVAGWRKVTDAVHAAGGRIFLQLWHVGRITHPVVPARRRPAGRALGDRRPRATPAPRAARSPRTPRALATERSRASSPSSRRRGARQGGRLRRRRDPRRQRLPDRPVPARRHQPAHRPLRRQRREPRPLPARGHRGRGRRLGRRPGRRAPLAAGRLQRHVRQRPARTFGTRSRRSTASASPTCTWSSSWARCRRARRRSRPAQGGVGGPLIANGGYTGARRGARIARGWADLRPFGVRSSPTPTCRASLRTRR